MEPSGAAELKTLLVGVPLPAGKAELLEYAVAPARRAAAPQPPCSRSREREYESLDEVAEDLLHVQPIRVEEQSTPHEESGAPPGGDAYTDPAPDTGRVRDRCGD